MPRDGAIIFSDLLGKLEVLSITCQKCEREAHAIGLDNYAFGFQRLDRSVYRPGLTANRPSTGRFHAADCAGMAATFWPASFVVRNT
jgi:hypothetical protein